MKQTLAALLALTLSAGAFATESQGTVIKQFGLTTTYVKNVVFDTEGKPSIVDGTFFDGDSLVQMPGGKCMLVRSRLKKMETFVMSGVTVQRPEVTITKKPAPCQA